MPRFAANLSTMFLEWQFLDRIDAAAAAGFARIECQFPYEAPASLIAARLAANGLELTMFNTPPGDLAAGELGFAALPGGHAKMRASFEQALDYALALGAKQLHLLAGRTPPTPASIEAFRASLAWATDRATDHGIGLLIEPLSRSDKPDYFLTEFTLAESLVDEIASANLRLQFDFYHARMNGLDVPYMLGRLLPKIGHVQVSSVPARQEPDEQDCLILRSLDEMGYRGVVGCEYWPRDGTLAGLNWRDRL